MFGERHDIPHEFPEYAALYEKLRDSDAAFEEMCQEYDNLDTEIRRIEQNVEPASDAFAEGLKKRRVLLKDKIYATLRAHSKK